MARVRDGHLTIGELLPMLDIECGIRLRQSCELMREADMMKPEKALPAL
jgi:hypothetical protein